MAGCSTYVLTEREFTENAHQLITISKSIGDTWQLHYFKGGDVECYLTKRQTINIHLSPNDEEGQLFDSEETKEVDEDPLTLNTVDSSSDVRKLCTFEYHVLYSTSYAAPVLYFTAYKQDGHLLSLEELWSSLSKLHQDRLQNDRWSFVTQQEHPVLHRPFYQLHPCKTGVLMALMKECQQIRSPCREDVGNPNMLVSWLSTVGPVVHLDIPVQYGICVQDPK